MKKIALLCGLLGLMSCKEELEKPAKFIDKGKMTDILYDFALLGGIDMAGAFYADTTISVVRVDAILKKYEIDSLTFVENNRYYIELGKESYFQIQEDIKQRLEAKKATLDKLEKEELEKKERLEEEEKVKKIKRDLSSDTIRKVVSKKYQQE